MRVLVTGHRGKVGTYVWQEFKEAGIEVKGFDVVDGDDILESDWVAGACKSVDAIVHLAALPHDTAGTPEKIMATNVLGTWNLLIAAERSGIERFVYFSSAQVFGVAEGEGPPDFYPIDDTHP